MDALRQAEAASSQSVKPTAIQTSAVGRILLPSCFEDRDKAGRLLRVKLSPRKLVWMGRVDLRKRTFPDGMDLSARCRLRTSISRACRQA